MEHYQLPYVVGHFNTVRQQVEELKQILLILNRVKLIIST